MPRKPWLEVDDPKIEDGASHQPTNIFDSPALVIPIEPVLSPHTPLAARNVVESDTLDRESALMQQRQVHKEIRRRALKRSLAEFVRTAWNVVEPSKDTCCASSSN
jgi:hypothetical protein